MHQGSPDANLWHQGTPDAGGAWMGQNDRVSEGPGTPGVLRRGDRGPAVAEVREILHQLDFYPAGPAPDAPYDAPYDDGLDRAVRHFQQQRGLTVDGNVGRETYRALSAARWSFGDRLLQHSAGRPMHGDDVVTLQQRLVRFGYDAGKLDGIFGAQTEQALRAFQRDYGLVADGTCGPGTLRALHQLVRSVSGGRPQLLRQEAAMATAGPRLFGKRIVIDPSHGGTDPGHRFGETTEADLVWDIAARIEGQLATAGATAFLTRGRNVTANTEERVALANSTEADLFVSMHVDSQPSAQARGVATYYFGNGLGESSSVGERFAELVRREVVARTGMLDCGTHSKTWDTLLLTRMPAVQLDCGYLSHAVDRRLLLDARFRSVVAQAVVASIQRLYLPEHEDYPTGTLSLEALRSSGG